MTRVIACVVLAAAAVSASSASAVTPGFYEAKRLEPAASFDAGKRVTVLCSTSKASFAASNSHLSVDGGGYVLPDDLTTMYLRSDVCAILHAWLNHRRVEDYDFASAALVLTHEATHLRGETDEGATDCAALAKLPAVIRRFFPPGRRTTVADLMLYARDAHSRKPAAYQGDC